MAPDRHRQKVLRPSLRRAFDQHVAGFADFRSEPRAQRRPPFSRNRRARSRDHAAFDLRHARRRRAGPRRIGKHVQEGQAAFLDERASARTSPRSRSGSRRSGRRRTRCRAASRRTCRRSDRVGARMPPLHALQDQVVACLQRQMQMRHQPRLLGDRAIRSRRPRSNRSRRGAAAAAPAHASGSASPARRASARRAGRRHSS